MNRLNHWIRSYFGFSKSEANGMIILIPLVLAILVSPYLYNRLNVKSINQDQDIKRMDSLVTVFNENVYYDSVKRTEEFFSAHRYSNFEKKRFEKTYEEKKDTKPKSFVHRKRTLEAFDINLADTTMLKRIPGIGSVTSKRILKYRNSLGGFIVKRQLHEVYGLVDSVLVALDTLAFVENGFEPKKIEINLIDEKTLSSHPYFGYSLAKSIVAYKFQHGKFVNEADLKNIHLVDSLKLQQILPYIKFNP